MALTERDVDANETPWVFRALGFGMRLVLPVLALLLVYGAAFVGLETFITWFDVFPDERWYLNPGYWLSAGHVVLPFAFLVSNLANRRYGLTVAVAQLLAAWAVIGAGVFIFSLTLESTMPASLLPSRRESLSFVFAIIVGQLIGIYVFDRTRGRTWWGAPLFSTLWGSAAFILIYYTLVFAGLPEPWPNYMLMDLALKVLAAGLLLIPYFLLRGIVRPGPGYGGY